MQHCYYASVTHIFLFDMPSHRKRIGFLPGEEVHRIIEQLCRDSKYSQSKVTGILVEEALRARGLLKNALSIKESNIKQNYDSPSNESNGNYEFNYPNKNNVKDDLKMINEYIEFKFFKKIMRQNKNILE